MNHSYTRKALCLALLIVLLVLGMAASDGYDSRTAFSPDAALVSGREEGSPASSFLSDSDNAEALTEFSLGEISVSSDTRELTLSAGSFDYDALLSALPTLTSLETLYLPETDLELTQIQALREATEGEVRYSVLIAGQIAEEDAESISLPGLTGEQLPELCSRLPVLEQLRSIQLGELQLTSEELEALAAAAPEAQLLYHVELCGQSYPQDTVSVDLSALNREELSRAAQVLPLLPELREVELMDAVGESSADKADVRMLMDALPQAAVHYEFSLFGTRVSTLDERVECNVPVLRDEDEEEIRAALDILPNCSYFKLDEDRFGISNEIMASIRDDYPNTKVVWRVFLDKANMLTDEEILRIGYVVNDRNTGPLRYCTDVVYLDFGHNSPLSDLSFIAYMPRLECVILSGSNIHDLSGFASCPNLTWLEMAYCPQVTDLSPLSGLQNLKYLNISITSVTDLSPLDTVPLERLMAMDTMLPKDQREHFEQAHPDCLCGWGDEFCYGYPWRYNEGTQGANNYFPYYARMREIFLYDSKGYCNRKSSPFGPGYLALRDHNIVPEIIK